jgi:hypothetical protein
MKKIKQNKTELAKKMAAYAATALSALAVAQPAAAAIQHNGPHNVPVPANGSVDINLDGDANADFHFSLTTDNTGWSLSVSGLNSAQFINAQPGNYNSDVMNLPAGYNIRGTLANPGTRYWTGAGQTVAGTYTNGGSTGNFSNAPGYMGVRFHTAACQGANWNYGWIHITATGSGGVLGSARIDDWAYESACNTAIAAGDVGAPVRATSVPTLDQWGLLALTALLSGAAIHRLKKGQVKA